MSTEIRMKLGSDPSGGKTFQVKGMSSTNSHGSSRCFWGIAQRSVPWSGVSNGRVVGFHLRDQKCDQGTNQAGLRGQGKDS